MSPLPKLSLKSLQPTASNLLKVWGVLEKVPKGGVLFGRLIGRMAAYTGTVRPEVVVLEKGHAVVRIQDTAKVRNHLKSVHAVALMNLGEAVTGVAMLVSVPDDARGIVTRLEMDYLKKARGPITGECFCDPPHTSEKTRYEVVGELKDRSGEVVAKVKAHWLIGPK